MIVFAVLALFLFAKFYQLDQLLLPAAGICAGYAFGHAIWLFASVKRNLNDR